MFGVEMRRVSEIVSSHGRCLKIFYAALRFYVILTILLIRYLLDIELGGYDCQGEVRNKRNLLS